MADEFRAFAVTIAAGTAIATPATTSLPVPIGREVRRIEIVIPRGCNGQVGFALAAARQPVIPYGAGQWIITDGEVLGWDLSDVLAESDLSLVGYNLGSFPHTLQVRLLLDLSADKRARNAAPLSGAQLSGTI